MTSDIVVLDAYRAKRRASPPEGSHSPLHGDGGGGTYDNMDSRVTRLEVLTDVTREELRDIKTELRSISSRLNDLPTKADLNSWRWQWLGMGIGIIALTVGGITGGLSLIARFAG